MSGGGLCEQANKFQTDKRRRGHNSADRTGSKWPGLEKFTRLVGLVGGCSGGACLWSEDGAPFKVFFNLSKILKPFKVCLNSEDVESF